MKEVIFENEMIADGKVVYLGLHNDAEKPVEIRLVKDRDTALLTVSIITSPTMQEMSECCSQQDSCDDCPVQDHCEQFYGEENQ